MNIHFEDKALLASLQAATIVQIEIGSALYGVKDEASDTDFLCIYVPSNNKVNSFLNTHHILQYKDAINRVDYVFEDVFSFIRNLLSGDSSINFEALHTIALQNSMLDFLYERRFYFYSYNMMKAYLGFCKRDRKYLLSNLTDREQAKKLLHIFRSYLFCENILKNDFVLRDEKIIQANKRYKAMNFGERLQEADAIVAKAEDLRKNTLNVWLEKRKIPRCMTIENQQDLDKLLYDFTKSEYYQSKVLEYRDLTLFYETVENGINY